MELLNTLIFPFVLILLFMLAVFIISLIKKDNSIVDVFWGIGFILISVASLFIGGSFYDRQTLVSGMVVVWGIRLASHIYLRNLGRGEDFRYKKWRKEWRKFFAVRSFLQIYMFQGFLLFAISLPVTIVNANGNNALGFVDAVGYLVWLFGFLFEAVGDFQLLRFRKDPGNKEKILNRGLWKYSRHPNYFGEATLWWGIYLMAISVPYGKFAIVSPILVTFLLLRVSGVKLLEKKYKGNLKYLAYKRRTSAFIPWFNKK